MIEGPIGIAHRRLAIVDLAGGHQPMSNEDGIDLDRLQRRDLQPRRAAARARQRAATAIARAAIRKPFFTSTRMKASAWPSVSKACSRLRSGTGRAGAVAGARPAWHQAALLRRHRQRAAVRFGDQGDSRRHASGAASIDASVMPEYLATGFVSGERTMFDGITRLLPGHTLTWSAEDGVRRRRYWQLPAPSSQNAAPFAAEAADLRERLTLAVKRHLMSDVPLGVFLSGGLDSSALAAIVSKMAAPPLRTFAVGLRGPRGQRARVREAGGGLDWLGASRRRGVARSILRGPAETDLARRRTDRVSVQRAAVLPVATGRRTRQGGADR